MKVRLNKATLRAFNGVVASAMLLLSFQNCGKAGFDADLDGSVDLGSSDAALATKYGSTTAAKVTDIPFAIEATFDTITYNSCSGTQVQFKPGYFTLKAGAYDVGGISLKPEYFNYVNANFNPIHPATSISETQYKEFLHDSPKNNSAIPVLALRVKNSLSSIPTDGGTAPVVDRDIIPLVGVLTDPTVVDAFARRNVVANYFPFSTEKRVMEGELTYNKNESLAEAYRQGLSNAYVLALTYLPKDEESHLVRSPSTATPVKTAYGKAYSFEFSQYDTANHSQNPARAVWRITETDLLGASAAPAKVWNCSRRYKIYRKEDNLCRPHTNAELANANVRRELEIARRHLKSDQWEVNVLDRCIYPKNFSCYGNQAVNGAPIVEYDLTKQCFNDGNNGALSSCMHFATVCTRN